MTVIGSGRRSRWSLKTKFMVPIPRQVSCRYSSLEEICPSRDSIFSQTTWFRDFTGDLLITLLTIGTLYTLSFHIDRRWITVTDSSFRTFSQILDDTVRPFANFLSSRHFADSSGLFFLHHRGFYKGEQRPLRQIDYFR